MTRCFLFLFFFSFFFSSRRRHTRSLCDWSSDVCSSDLKYTAGNEFGPCLSPDGHVMYFASDRPGGFGGNDIYFSRRHNKRDDFGWQLPDNLGNVVNTAANESSPQIFEDDESGLIALYFDSNRPGGPGPFTDDPPPTGVHNGNDLYASSFQPDETFGAATLVAELSSPFVDRQPTIRRDGLEIVFASNRPGSLGGTLDLWVSARLSTSDPWSTPANLGPTVNVASAPPFSGADGGPALSFDGTTLYFQSSRPGNFGGALFDLYMSTR